MNLPNKKNAADINSELHPEGRTPGSLSKPLCPLRKGNEKTPPHTFHSKEAVVFVSFQQMAQCYQWSCHQQQPYK